MLNSGPLVNGKELLPRTKPFLAWKKSAHAQSATKLRRRKALLSGKHASRITIYTSLTRSCNLWQGSFPAGSPSCIQRARKKRSSPPSMSSTSCKTAALSPTYVQLTRIVLKTHKGFCQHEQRICRRGDGMSFAHNVRPPPTRCSPTDSYTRTRCALGCCTVGGAAALAHLARRTTQLMLCKI